MMAVEEHSQIPVEWVDGEEWDAIEHALAAATSRFAAPGLVHHASDFLQSRFSPSRSFNWLAFWIFSLFQIFSNFSTFFVLFRNLRNWVCFTVRIWCRAVNEMSNRAALQRWLLRMNRSVCLALMLSRRKQLLGMVYFPSIGFMLKRRIQRVGMQGVRTY
jgi:hypothetical protein